MEPHIEHITAGIAITKNEPGKARSATGTKRKRSSHDQQDIPWTASRCNRLLRTITSRISILQKLAAANRLHIDDKTAKAPRGVDCEPPEAETRQPVVTTLSKDDPEWLPTQGKKTETTTYAGKAKQRRKAALHANKQPDHTLGLSTPFVRRMLRREPSGASSESDSSSTRPFNKSKSRQLPVQPSSLAEEACRGLTLALETFLVATKPPAPRLRTGTSSLRSACLRRIPDYVDLEQTALNEDEDADEDEKRDAADEIYAELEDLGVGSEKGWAGLREVVRADGIAKICNAMRCGLLPLRIMEALVSVCSRVNAAAEAQQLVEARLLCTQSLIKEDELEQLCAFGLNSDSHTFILRILRTLLEDERLAAIVVCKQQAVWQSLLKSVMQPGDAPRATAFLHVILRGLQGTGAHETSAAAETSRQAQGAMERIAALLTAVAWANRKPQGGSNHIARMLLNVSTTLEISSRAQTRIEVSSIALQFGLSSFTLLALDQQVPSQYQQLSIHDLAGIIIYAREAEANDKTKRRYRLTGDNAVSQMALCIRRWDTDTADSFIETVATQLLYLAGAADHRMSELYKALALNNAAAYADTVNDKASALIADEIEEMVLQDMPSLKARTPKLVRTPGPVRPKEVKYRWEDGLCEWILKTPLIRTGQLQQHGTELPAAIPRIKLVAPGKPAGPSRRLLDVVVAPTVPQEMRKAFHSKRNTLASKSHAEQETEDIAVDSVIEGSDDDELALSVKKVKRSAPPPPLPLQRRVPQKKPAQSLQQIRKTGQRPQKLQRCSSGSSAWGTTELSEDELGV